MNTSKSDIQITEAEYNEYLALARAKRVAIKRQQRKILTSSDDPRAKEILSTLSDDGTTYENYAEANFGGLLVAYVGVDIYVAYLNQKKIGHYGGAAGGLYAGGGHSMGAVILEVPISTLNNVDAKFELNYAAGILNINWWDDDTNAFLGSFVGGVIGLGVGVMGGDGTFYYYP